jgi:hypothetical protein
VRRNTKCVQRWTELQEEKEAAAGKPHLHQHDGLSFAFVRRPLGQPTNLGSAKDNSGVGCMQHYSTELDRGLR